MHGPVDTVKWLDEINANYLLTASIWETLGYTIAEAMATWDQAARARTVGAELNWPSNVVEHWWNFEELNWVTEPLPSRD